MGANFSAPVQTGPGAHPVSSTMGTRSFPEVNSGRGVTLTPHHPLVPWSWKGRAIPVLTLRAVRPVQSLSACARVRFTFTFTSKQWSVTYCYTCAFVSSANVTFEVHSIFWVFNYQELERNLIISLRFFVPFIREMGAAHRGLVGETCRKQPLKRPWFKW